MAKKHPAAEAPAKASKGLLFPSETDAPLEPFLWEGADKLTKDRVRQLAGAAKGAAVEEMTLDDLLSTVPEEDRPQFDKTLGEGLKNEVPADTLCRHEAVSPAWHRGCCANSLCQREQPLSIPPVRNRG